MLPVFQKGDGNETKNDHGIFVYTLGSCLIPSLILLEWCERNNLPTEEQNRFRFDLGTTNVMFAFYLNCLRKGTKVVV